MRCESSVTVVKPPADVFPWLLDADKVPRWMTGLDVYQQLEPGPLRLGSRIHQVLSVSGHQLRFELEVAHLEPPHAAVMRFSGSGYKAANEYSVRDAAGGAEVTWVISGETTSLQGAADRADGAGQAAGEDRDRPGASACRTRRRGGGRMIRRALLLLVPLLLLLLVPAQASAGELIDRAVAGLQSDNVYVDPERRSEAHAGAGRGAARPDRRVGAGPMYVVVAPSEINREAGGDPTKALARSASASGARPRT